MREVGRYTLLTKLGGGGMADVHLAVRDRSIDPKDLLALKVPKEEATVVMVFDVSGSMNAEDVEPTRLIAAQEAANAFLDRIPEKFRVGMVSFSESARVVLPPTDDRELARDADGTEGISAREDAQRRTQSEEQAGSGTLPSDQVIGMHAQQSSDAAEQRKWKRHPQYG